MMEVRIKTGNSQSHADLAMRAARGVARARRRSQKAKMGHVVCRHLLQMLSDETAPAVPCRPLRPPLLRETVRHLEDKQFSLGF